MEVEMNRMEVEMKDVEEQGRSLEAVSPEVFMRVEGVDLSLRKGGKKLLDGVDADFGPGELAAIMGPSGAGKTTLLNILSARMFRQVATMTKGKVTANGVIVSKTEDFSRWGTVAPQDDVVLPALSVFESLDYAARLRGSTPGRVEGLLKTFELSDRRTLKAGSLSGGQRKRLSIAMELVHAPSVILVDEPTSGLDSRVAFQVVKSLRDLALSTRTNVACTIHQPSIETFLCFDRLLMLTDGKVAFRGTIAFAADVFHQELPAISGGKSYARNPADSAIDRVTNADDAVSFWEKLLEDNATFKESERLRLDSFLTVEGLSSSQKKPPKLKAFFILFERTLLQSFRLQGTFQLKSACVTGLVYGLVFFQQQNTQERGNMKIAILFLSLLMNGLVPGLITALVVPLERPTLRREAWNGVWHLSEYLAARSLTAAVIHTCSVTLYTAVIYNMVDMKGNYLRFLWPLILLGLITQQLGLLLGSLLSSAVKSVPAFLPINIGSVIFAGFFFQKSFLTKNAQKVVYPFWYFSWYRYAFALIVTNEFQDGKFTTCDVSSGDNCPYAGFADFSGQLHVPRDVVTTNLLKINVSFTLRHHWLILIVFFAGFYLATYLLINKITLRP